MLALYFLTTLGELHTHAHTQTVIKIDKRYFIHFKVLKGQPIIYETVLQQIFGYSDFFKLAKKEEEGSQSRGRGCPPFDPILRHGKAGKIGGSKKELD